MNKFTFDEKTHNYFLGDKPLTGCTTILSVIGGNKTGALIQWAANMAVEYVKDKWGTNGLTAKDLFEVLDEARTAHRKKKEEAGQKGTDVHKMIEDRIKILIRGGDIGVVSGNKQVDNFIKWTIDNKVKFLESEKRVYSKQYFCAGTYDFKCEIDGKIYIADIKTGGVYDRIPFAQMAAYQMMELENEPDNKIDGRLIINIKKDGKFDSEKDVQFSYDTQTDLDLFLSALKIYRILNNY